MTWRVIPRIWVLAFVTSLVAPPSGAQSRVENIELARALALGAEIALAWRMYAKPLTGGCASITRRGSTFPGRPHSSGSPN